MTEHDVVIVGGGPTGLTLAAELALAEVDVVVVERRADQGLVGQRAGGLHARTIEIFDQRGIADRFLAAGQVAQVAGFAWFPLDIADLPTRHPYGLALAQNQIEPILAAWVDELRVPILRERDATGFTQDEAGVEVSLSDGHTLRGRYLVGCDGGRSLIRKAAGVAFPGWDATTSLLIGEVHLSGEPPSWGLRHDLQGIHSLVRTPEGTVRVLVTEPRLGGSSPPDLADLRAALAAGYGTDLGVHAPVWLSRFTDASRQAAAYRARRVLLAGDAAHVHFPAGGQGLNLGVQDAVNLGWKLAQVVKGISPDSLLDTYHAERHPVAARVLRYSLAQVLALRRLDDSVKALREVLGELFGLDEARRRFGARISGLDVHYDLGSGHPLVGRRMPDLDLVTPDGPRRTYPLLHAARPVLLDLGGPGSFDLGPWADRVRATVARCDGPWDLPAIGPVPAPTAVLIRPDGHVAWVGQGSWEGLGDALSFWFGPPAAA